MEDLNSPSLTVCAILASMKNLLFYHLLLIKIGNSSRPKSLAISGYICDMKWTDLANMLIELEWFGDSPVNVSLH